MPYLLDSNVLVTAANTYYGIPQVPELWTWLLHQGESGVIKTPLEIHEEVAEGRKEGDELLGWIKHDTNRVRWPQMNNAKIELVQRVVKEGYANDLTDDEVEKIDPFLISYALGEAERCIVTTEISKSSRKRHNRHIPDICATLGVNCCRPWDLNRKLGVKTAWKA